MESSNLPLKTLLSPDAETFCIEAIKKFYVIILTTLQNRILMTLISIR
jgi:hypothetical protein